MAQQQAIAHRLADLTTRVAAARLLVHQAARAYDAGLPGGSREISHLAAMAKLLATETAQEAVDAAIQFHGARALEEGHPLEHLYREVRAPRILRGRLRDPAGDHRPTDIQARRKPSPVQLGRRVVMVADQLVTLIYELLDAHDDTAEMASELDNDLRWRAHLDYLRTLQRRGREALAETARQEA